MRSVLMHPGLYSWHEAESNRRGFDTLDNFLLNCITLVAQAMRACLQQLSQPSVISTEVAALPKPSPRAVQAQAAAAAAVAHDLLLLTALVCQAHVLGMWMPSPHQAASMETEILPEVHLCQTL